MDCGSSDPMVQEPLLSFSAVFFPPMIPRSSTMTQPPVKLFTFKETDLKKGFDLQKFHLADVRIHREEAGVRSPNIYPPGAAVTYCPVSRSFLIVGGDLPSQRAPLRSIWSFCADDASQPRPGTPSNYTWEIRANMSHERSWGFAVPCDGLVYIIGGERCPEPSLEIYDPRSGFLDPPIPLDGDIFHHRSLVPYSYCLWRDSSEPPHKKPLILLMFSGRGRHQLLSFDVEKKLLAMFDPDFPPPYGRVTGRTRLVPLEGTDTLLIMEFPNGWLVYDLIDRKVIGEVDFMGFKGWDRDVMHGLCRQCLDGSHIVYVFMDAFDYEDIYSQFSVRYAKFRLQKEEDGRFVATLESEGALGNGECSDFFIFADQTTMPEEAPDPPLSGDEGRPGKRRR